MSECLTIEQFNQLEPPAATRVLLTCCHAHAWAAGVVACRPFANLEQLLLTADAHWQTADEAQILEAFNGHARIGDIELLRSKYAGKATAEQGQVLQASEMTIRRLYQLNREYEAMHGFIFIVCATGKSADEMLALLTVRMKNTRAQELLNGAEEQGKITRLRLTKLFSNV